MSVTGISGSSLFELVQAEKNQTQSTQSNTIQNIGQEFGQLGQDLQAGNLTQAQQDFTTLSSDLSSLQGSSSTPDLRQFQFQHGQQHSAGIQLAAAGFAGRKCHAGAADFGNLQQSLQSAGQGQQSHGHHHHHGGGGSQQASAIQQDFTSLGNALQSGDLSTAQSAFAQLQQDRNFSGGGSSSSSTSASASSSTGSTNGTTLNVTA